MDILASRYLNPLRSIAAKLNLYEQLVEHVVDMQKLPELKVNSMHDSELQELETEQQVRFSFLFLSSVNSALLNSQSPISLL